MNYLYVLGRCILMPFIYIKCVLFKGSKRHCWSCLLEGGE